MPGNVKLDSIEIEGFRGVNKRVHLDFGRNATVVSAWNGRGKSTILGAVEWGLFGELRFQPPENRTRDELVSVFHPGGRASVILSLAVGPQRVRVTRTRVVGKMASELEVRDESGRTLESEDARAYLFRLTGLNFDDFYRAAFLHQDSIRGLLTEEQKDRDEALDRLLGVEKIRNILTSIPMKPVTDALAEIEDREGKLMVQLAGAGGVAEQTRSDALAEAEEAGYSEDDLTLDNGKRQANALRMQLSSATKDYGGEAIGEIDVEAAEDLEKVARRVKTSTKEMRLAVGKASPLDEAVGRMTSLKQWRAEIEGAQADLKTAREEIAAHEKSNGPPDSWSKESATLSDQIALNQKALHVLDVHGRVVADAIAYLKAVPSANECPVCGDPKEASKLAKLLESKVAKSQAAEVDRLNGEVERGRDRLGELAELVKGRLKLQEALQEAEEACNDASEAVWRSFGKKGPVGDVLAEIAAEHDGLEGRLEILRKAGVDREEKLQALDEQADRLRALMRFLKADDNFRRVREKAREGEGGGAKALEEDKGRLLGLKAQLEAITGTLTGLASGLSEGALARSGPDISKTYARLCNHPYYDGLKIEVSQKTVQGVPRNTYRIIAFSKDGQRTSASSRLSTAQMNCVALSVYLSLAKVLSHNLGFVMLDDPSQNLDSEHKTALASVLNDLMPGTQLVIGTHDAEFDNLLRHTFGSEEIAWFDLGWAPKDGTVVKPSAAVSA
jgi:DNA repair protein SbcC/Rad50